MSQIATKLEPWFEARRRFKLSHVQIQMARELGMNPKNFGKLANHKQEPWKAPLPQFIEACYEKKFHRNRPENLRTLEELIVHDKQKRAEKKAKKEQERATVLESRRKPQAGNTPVPPVVPDEPF